MASTKLNRVEKLKKTIDNYLSIKGKAQDDLFTINREDSILSKERREIIRRISDNKKKFDEVKEIRRRIAADKKRLYEILNLKIEINRKINITSKVFYDAERNHEEKTISFALLKKNEEEKTIVKKKLKKGEFSEPILKNVLNLPEELIRIIGGYLTYEVKNKLIHSRNSTGKLLSCLDTSARNRFLQRICRSRDFLSILNPYEADAEIREIRPGVLNPNYKPFMARHGERKEGGKNKIMYVINLAKDRNPKFAYKILSIIHIMFEPTKKYSIKRGIYALPRAMTMSDIASLS